MPLDETATRQQSDSLRLELLSLEQLRLFVIGARAKSFSEVARACGKTQSTISIAINNLEIDIGVQLFVRDTQGIRLSPAGQALYPAALDILTRLKLFEQRALRLSETGAEQFTLHMDSFFPYMKLVDAVSELERRHPNTEITVKIDPPYTAFRNWTGNTEDLIVTSRPLAMTASTDARSVPVGQVQFLPVTSRNNELAHKTGLDKAELEKYRQVVFDTGRKNNSQATGSRRITVDGLVYQQNLIRSGTGWGYMPEHFVQDCIEKGDLKVLNLADCDYYPTLGFSLAWHAREPLSEIKQELVDLLTGDVKPVRKAS